LAITVVADFIESNLLDTLLKLKQKVMGLDNFSNLQQRDLDIVQSSVTSAQWQNFSCIQADICNLAICQTACECGDYVLQEAEIGSFPRFREDQISSNVINFSGFLNFLDAAPDAKVKRFVYAAKSGSYDDQPSLPKVKDKNSKP